MEQKPPPPPLPSPPPLSPPPVRRRRPFPPPPPPPPQAKATKLFPQNDAIYNIIKPLDVSKNLLHLLVHKVFRNKELTQGKFDLACLEYNYFLLCLRGSCFLDPCKKQFIDLLRSFHEVCKDENLDRQLLTAAIQINPTLCDFSF